VTLFKSTRIDRCGSTDLAACQHFSSSPTHAPASFPSTTKHVISESLEVVILSILTRPEPGKCNRLAIRAEPLTGTPTLAEAGKQEQEHERNSKSFEDLEGLMTVYHHNRTFLVTASTGCLKSVCAGILREFGSPLFD
jgi:hypothetical protein